MGKDSPLKNRKKYVAARTNKFFEEESSIDNCTGETFYTGGSSKGKQFFYPTFNITEEKFTGKRPFESTQNSRFPTPEKKDEIIRTTTIKSKMALFPRAKSLENSKSKTDKYDEIRGRNSINITNIKLFRLGD
jgi:hypothetical protein